MKWNTEYALQLWLVCPVNSHITYPLKLQTTCSKVSFSHSSGCFPVGYQIILTSIMLSCVLASPAANVTSNEWSAWQQVYSSILCSYLPSKIFYHFFLKRRFFYPARKKHQLCQIKGSTYWGGFEKQQRTSPPTANASLGRCWLIHSALAFCSCLGIIGVRHIRLISTYQIPLLLLCWSF